MNKPKRLPAKTCIFCNKTIEEVGGMRIVAQKIRGVKLSNRYIGGGDKNFPHKSIKLSYSPDIYMVFWGKPEKWNQKAVKSAKDAYQKGFQPWYCQICGERKCKVCGSPINYPMGSDIVDDKGCISHIAIFPFDSGCINPKCIKYKNKYRN